MGFLDLRICMYYNYYTHIIQNYTVQMFLASLICLKISFHRFNQNGSKFEAIQASAAAAAGDRADQIKQQKQTVKVRNFFSSHGRLIPDPRNLGILILHWSSFL